MSEHKETKTAVKNEETQNVLFPDGGNPKVQKDQLMVPTPYLIGFLVVAFFIIKKFIYITDEKRKNK